MILSLATYTAEKGLSWFYDKSAIGFEELDRCRRLLGNLPDFDAGDGGYEGVATVADKIFVIRCVSAPKWDFMGRDATFLRVAWFPRQQIGNVDAGKILASDVFCELSHEYRYSIDVECELPQKNSTEWNAYSQMISNELQAVFIRREIGQKAITVKVANKGVAKMTEAEKFFSSKDAIPQAVSKSASVESKQVHNSKVQSNESKIEYSVGARVFAVVSFIVLAMLGVYLARLAGKELLGYIVMATAFGVLRALWNVRR